MHKHTRPVSTRDMILETLGDEIWEKQELLAKIAETKTPKKAAEALQFLVENKYVSELDYITDDPEGGQLTVVLKCERAEDKTCEKSETDALSEMKSPQKVEGISPKKNLTPSLDACASQGKDTGHSEDDTQRVQTPIVQKGLVRRKRLPFHSPRSLASGKENSEPEPKRPSVDSQSDMPSTPQQKKAISNASKNVSPSNTTSNQNTPGGTPQQVRKHSIPELISLTEKWKDVCKQVLYELKEHSQDPNVDYPKILDFFKIESNIIRYNAEDDCLE